VTQNIQLSGAESMYVVSDGVTVALPPADKKGQMLVLIESADATAGFSITRWGTDLIKSNYTGVASVSQLRSVQLISDGNGTWMLMVMTKAYIPYMP